MPIDEKTLQSVALFPLPNMVLFPGAVVPLYIFEPRYREMTRDALSKSRLLVMGNLLPGHEADYPGRPPVHTVAGLGKIIDSEMLPDGRYALLLQGIARVTIERELPADRAYRVVHAKLLADEPASVDLDPLREELINVFEVLCRGLGEAGRDVLATLRGTEAASRSADLVAANFIANSEHRQALLEIRDPAKRLQRVREHVAKLVIATSQDPRSLN